MKEDFIFQFNPFRNLRGIFERPVIQYFQFKITEIKDMKPEFYLDILSYMTKNPLKSIKFHFKLPEMNPEQIEKF